MERHLYLARHAHAESDAPSDAQRPLSDKGYRQMRRLVGGFASNGLLQPEAIWHSGYRRALETAYALKEGLRLEPPLLAAEGLAPFDGPEDVAARLNPMTDSVLLVGHEPHLSSLAATLLSGVSVEMAKASVLCLSCMQVGASRSPWRVAWHVSHKRYK